MTKRDDTRDKMIPHDIDETKDNDKRRDDVAAEVEKLLADRTAARARKDFKESDRIRDELAAMGVVIKDSKEGTTWEVAR